jgi:hypothetical protein
MVAAPSGTRSVAQGPRLGRQSTTTIGYTAPRALAANYKLGDDLTERLAGMDAMRTPSSKREPLIHSTITPQATHWRRTALAIARASMRMSRS